MLNVLLRPHHMELLRLDDVVSDDLLHGVGADVARCQDSRLKSILHLLQIDIAWLYDVVDEGTHLDGGWRTARGSDRESGRR